MVLLFSMAFKMSSSSYICKIKCTLRMHFLVAPIKNNVTKLASSLRALLMRSNKFFPICFSIDYLCAAIRLQGHLPTLLYVSLLITYFCRLHEDKRCQEKSLISSARFSIYLVVKLQKHFLQITYRFLEV